VGPVAKLSKARNRVDPASLKGSRTMHVEPQDTLQLYDFSQTRRAWPPGALSRLLDIVIASVALLFFLPVFALIALAIKFADPGPVFFRQRRVGLGGKTFGCWKFRTMVVDAEARLEKILVSDPVAAREWAEHQKLTDDPRVTALGNFLRRSSLDELPQFFNVLMGEMSIVGPRPIVETEAARYGQHFASCVPVSPGSGRSRAAATSTTSNAFCSMFAMSAAARCCAISRSSC
jgi:exopolysaccharide production protein ExoY